MKDTRRGRPVLPRGDTVVSDMVCEGTSEYDVTRFQPYR